MLSTKGSHHRRYNDIKSNTFQAIKRNLLAVFYRFAIVKCKCISLRANDRRNFIRPISRSILFQKINCVSDIENGFL